LENAIILKEAYFWDHKYMCGLYQKVKPRKLLWG